MTKPSDCSCEACRSLCHGLPGWFLPSQILPAAAHLGLSPQEFFEQYLMVDYYVDDPCVDVLSPATVNTPASSYAPWAPEKGSCRLLDESGCRLPLDLRPYECALTMGCRPNEHFGRLVSIRDAWEADPSPLQIVRVIL